jgi:hypothetical protein
MTREQLSCIRRRLQSANQLIDSGQTRLSPAACLAVTEVAEAVHELLLLLGSSTLEPCARETDRRVMDDSPSRRSAG